MLKTGYIELGCDFEERLVLIHSFYSFTSNNKSEILFFCTDRKIIDGWNKDVRRETFDATGKSDECAHVGVLCYLRHAY